MRAAALLAAALCAALLGACNTMHGIGRDIEAAGEAIQRKAR